MDVVHAVRSYVDKMASEVRGMKILLLDSETTAIVSAAVSQSHLFAKEIYLVDRIDNQGRDTMRHLKCICFLRPDATSIQALVDELREPKYGDYYLFFSNVLKKSAIERIAEMDDQEVVREVQEYFADFVPLTSDLFTLNVTASLGNAIYADSVHAWDQRALRRTTDGLTSLLLALKKRPVIRYEAVSAMARKLADEVQYSLRQEPDLCEFKHTDVPPLLLILDRRNDPVTPLLTQWTYQAMTHQELGIRNGRVDMSEVPDIRRELREIVLAPDQDPFFARTQHLNFGELGAAIKSYVDEYQTRTQSTIKIESIGDMKRFVEEYPEFRRMSGNVSKHVALVGELSRCVDVRKLLRVSELEQSLACNQAHAVDLKALRDVLADTTVPKEAKLRLVVLYALRYEKNSAVATRELEEEMLKLGFSEQEIANIGDIVFFCGADQRQGDLFKNENIFSRGRNIIAALKGVENVYTQHVPFLTETLDQVIKSRLPEKLYPCLEGQFKDRPQDIIVFFVGGITYAEERHAAQIAAQNPGIRMVLGGTTVHNSASFLAETQDASKRFPPSAGRRLGLARQQPARTTTV